MVCGATLSYQEKSAELTCSYCGCVEQGHICCPQGHYICNICHNQDAMKVIENILFTTRSADPLEIAELAMSFSALPMLGCQHAYIAGGAFMAAIKNEGSRGITDEDIREVFKRTERQAHGGYCGLTGVCGIAPAIGACFSVLTGSQCGKDKEQKITMEAVTRVSRAITELTGPSCCKAYVKSTIISAAGYLRESLGIELMRQTPTVCIYGARHPHGCRYAECPYTDKNATKVDNSNIRHNAILTDRFPEQLTENKIQEDSMEYLLKKAIQFGAEKAKIITADSVIVEEWVRWKCQYGCPLYDKDPFHPPCAPDAESTKKVLKEYAKAILMNGPRGKILTEAVVKLEGEAYHSGYYKAFALTALSSGFSGTG